MPDPRFKKFKNELLDMQMENTAICNNFQVIQQESATQLKSLFKLCVQFIARNLSFLDSLVGFPEVIGKILFEEAVENDSFSITNINTPKSLKKFTEAYGEFIISSLSLKNESLLVNCVLESICTLDGLAALDLSHCKLGNDHEVLTYISELESLEVLVLRDNSLTDQGIQRLTTPLRVLQRGPKRLRYLDLSENRKLTSLCSRYLKAFRDLELLDLSFSGVTAGAINWVCDTLRMHKTEDTDTVTAGFSVETIGWAKKLIDLWKRETMKKTEKVEVSNRKGKLNSCSSFYRKKIAEAHTHSNRGSLGPFILVSCNGSKTSPPERKTCDSKFGHHPKLSSVTFERTCSDSSGKTLFDAVPKMGSTATHLQNKVSGKGTCNSCNTVTIVDDTDLLSSYLCTDETKPVQKGSLLSALD